MKVVSNDTPSEFLSYQFNKTKKKRGENILTETILDIHVPFQRKTDRPIIKLEKEVECWKREFFASLNLCGPTVADKKNDKRMAQKLKKIETGTHRKT